MTAKPLQNCGKCGICLNACPVYSLLKEEQVSPRAKLHLIDAYDSKKLSSSPFLKEIISRCLMCGSCSAQCPSGIDHYAAFMEMRRKMAEEHGEPPAVKSLIYLLAREYRAAMGAGLAKKSQAMMPESVLEKFKIGHISIKHLPKLNPAPFGRSGKDLGETHKPKGKSRGRVVYFTGCATRYLFEDTGKSVVSILNHMGFEVFIPGSQTCCSIPLLFHGAGKMAQKNIRDNIKALEGPGTDAIITDCSTCGEALKNEYPKYFQDDKKMQAEASRISSRVSDFMAFVFEHQNLLTFNPGSLDRILVTYHAPCHTRNTFKSHLAAEALIQSLPNVTYRRAPDFDQCCGGGGTFFYEHANISKKMVDKKLMSVKSLDISHVLTDCPVCRMNLSGNMDKSSEATVLHPAILMERALKKI